MRQFLLSLVVVVVSLSMPSTNSHAESSATPTPQYPARPSALKGSALKFESTALRLSIEGTILPVVAGGAIFALSEANKSHDQSEGRYVIAVGMAAAGLVFGPALGERYVGRHGGLWFRMGVGAIGAVLGNSFYQKSRDSHDDFGPAVAGVAAGAAAATILIISDIHDISNVKLHTRE